MPGAATEPLEAGCQPVGAAGEPFEAATERRRQACPVGQGSGGPFGAAGDAVEAFAQTQAALGEAIEVFDCGGQPVGDLLGFLDVVEQAAAQRRQFGGEAGVALAVGLTADRIGPLDRCARLADFFDRRRIFRISASRTALRRRLGTREEMPIVSCLAP